MRRPEAIVPWILEQSELYDQAGSQNTGFPGSETDPSELKEKAAKLKTLAFVLRNFSVFERYGLSGDINIQVLNDLKTFCVSEKERYREMAYTDVKNVELFDKLDEDSNAMTYYQEAEIYVIRLIVLSRG